ncbi:MAG: GNAT family N-acetyltransferase [Candidatus Sumerlaeia bacterium]
MVILQTPRLILREWTIEDLDKALPIYKDPEVMKCVFPFRPLSERRLRLNIEKWQADCRTHKWGIWAVILKHNIELIGHCGFDYLDHTENIEFQVLLDRRRWGLGLGTEIGRETLRYGLEKLGFEEITAVTPPTNPRGARLAEKLGFSFIGEDVYYGTSMCCYSIRRV